MHIVSFGIYCTVLELVGGGEMGGLGRSCIRFKLSVYDLQLHHGKRGIHVIFHFSPILH